MHRSGPTRGGDGRDDGLRLFERHFDRLHSLFRLCLAQPEEAQEALLATLGEVAQGSAGLTGRSEVEAAHWVDDIALAQLARRHRVAAGPRPATPPRLLPRRPLVREERELLDSLDDATLAILVRGLERETRIAVALGLVHGIDRRRVALVLGCPVERVDMLQRGALGQLADLLSRHQHERFRQPARPSVLARTTAPHLRPLPAGASDGIIVIRGTKAMVVPGPPQSVYDLVRALVERVLDRIRRRQMEHHFDDEVGTSADAKSRRPPPPTPTTQPLAKPKRTPTLRDYRKPDTTRGTATHDRSPKSTPGTERIGAPRRVLGSGVNAYGWTSTGGRARGR
jgi:DNA-directed RNA polymerase specialized sigma24 family protein